MSHIFRFNSKAGKEYKIIRLDDKDTTTMTPSIIEALLKDSNGFKSPNKTQIKKLRKNIEDNTFDEYGSILLDKKDCLIDGYNRLKAAQEAGKSIKQIVFFGADKNGQYVVDTGLRRTIAQLVKKKMHVKYPSIWAQVAAIMINMNNSPDDVDGILEKSGVPITTHEIINMVKNHPDLEASITKIVPSKSHFKTTCIAHLVLLDYLCRRDGSPKKADEFLRILSDEVSGIDNDNPVKVLREKLSEGLRKDRLTFDRRKQVSLMILTYNLFRTNKKIKSMQIPSKIPRLAHKS